MLTQYKNIDQIRNSTSAILAERYPSINKNLFKSTGYTFDPSITTSGAGSQIELHVYASDNWLTGNHSVNAIKSIPVYYNTETGNEYSFGSTPLIIDVAQQLQDLEIQTGNYTFVVNLSLKFGID